MFDSKLINNKMVFMKVTFGRNTIAYKFYKRIPSIATAFDQVLS